MRVLLVEKDPSIREALRMLIEVEGHDCVEAADGLQAKSILEQDSPFELMITEFHLAKMDGIELLDWCRKNKIHFPVIFLTSSSQLFDREKIALSDCCAALLRKPAGIQQVSEAIAAAVARNHQRECNLGKAAQNPPPDAPL